MLNRLSKTILFQISLITFFLFLNMFFQPIDTYAGCATGYYCSGTTVIDLYNGCNEIPGADYCTQAYIYYNSVSCDSNCSFVVPGAVCLDTIKPCNYTWYANYYSGNCCVLDPSCTGCGCTPSCPSSYPLSSCPSGHDCSSTTVSCTKVDSCGVACGGSNTKTCYKDNGSSCTPCNWCTSVGCGECSTTTSGWRCECSGSCEGQYSSCIGVADPTCVLCSCGSWSNQGCGASTCSDTQMYQTRTCDPSGCDSTTRCIADSSCSCSCSNWVDQSCGGGSCSDTQMYQTRSCNPSGCASTTQCVADASCNCDCTSWVDGGCGGGSCADTLMYQTRTCDPSGCDSTSRCIIDTSCSCTGCSDCTPTCPPSGYPAYDLYSCPSGHDCSTRITSCNNVDSCGDFCGSNSDTCFRDDGPICVPGCTVSCPSGTSKSFNVYDYLTEWCWDDCGDPDSDRCYCTSGCTVPSCDINTSPFGDGAYYKTESCNNTCGWSDSNDCYYVCEEATCANLVSEVNWLDSCPDGETCESVTMSVPISTVYPGCPGTETKTCYYPNEDPLVDSLSILVERYSPEVVLQYSSEDTYSGIDLNNPVRVNGTYSDPNGAQDIEAIYVWWSIHEDIGNLTTPTRLDRLGTNDGQLENNSNFGVMLARNSSDQWELYIPDINTVGNSYWTNQGSIAGEKQIIGSDSELNTVVTITDITVVENGNDVELEMAMVFESEDELVNSEMYNLWGSVNDIVGFDPFYNDTIRKSNWRLTPTDWYVDLIEPTADQFDFVVSGIDNQITIEVKGRDNQSGVSVARLDACISGSTDIHDLEVAGGDTYDLQLCSGGFNESDRINMSTTTTSLDSLLEGDGLIDSANFTVSKNINLGLNDAGAITFYLTVMDKGGNYSQTNNIFKLGDWAVVENGLLYGNQGTRSETRTLDPATMSTAWDSTPFGVNSYLDELTSDLSNEALLGGEGIQTTDLRELVHYIPSENKSFKAINTQGLLMDSLFNNLQEAYLTKAVGTNFKISDVGLTDNISGTLRTYHSDPTKNCATEEFCVLQKQGDLSIDSGFECDGKGLIVVDGNLTINPNFTNSTDTDSCIILASGDITITQGDNVASPPDPGYDSIEAFLIAQRQIIIQTDPVGNGLFVEGGMISYSSLGIENNRDIGFSLRNAYPVIAVEGKFKYSALGKSIFGSQVDIFKTELGFKPY